jgi:hypothetical protein
VGPSQIADFRGTWTGTLDYVSCRQSSGCPPKTCHNEADFASHTTATFTLLVHQTGGTATADLTIDEHNPDVLWREAGRLSGQVAGELELVGSTTRGLVGRATPFGKMGGLVGLSSSVATDDSRPQIRGSITRRTPGSRCIITSHWRFEGVRGGQ